LINPDLPVAPVAPVGGPGPGPALAYHLLPASARAAYLAWLAGGRNTDVAGGLVQLFCFGLERRVLLDADHDPAVRRELPAITAEVRRLRVRYADTGSAVRTVLDRLSDLLELLSAPRTTAGRSSSVTADPDRMAVQVALARFAVTSAPVPAEWARAWVRHHPSLTPRSAQVRCPEEFDRLFALRYAGWHGAGWVPPDDVPGIRLKYQPANPGLTTVLVCREDLPDVLAEPRGTRMLGALVDEVSAGLDPYSRWLARFPQGRGSLAAAAQLPPDLVGAGQGVIGGLRTWAEARLAGRPSAVIDAAEFGAFWSTAAPDRMAHDEATALLSVLALLGLGVEPDVRFGGPTLAPGPAVLFRLGGATADRPSARFRAAAAVIRCAAAVLSTAGQKDPNGPVSAAVRDLAALFRVDPGEDLRLVARLGWLLTTTVNVDRLGRQTAALDPTDREIAGRCLITLAVAADPSVGPATVAVLTRTYRILGLEPNLVFGRLHERSAGGSPARSVAGPAAARSTSADEPVVVRPADPVADGYALPWAGYTPATGGVTLDQETIMRKVSESAVAATLLTSIFDTAPPEPLGAAEPTASADPGQVAGLDRPHSLLLRTLAVRPSWTREEFASLAGTHGVLPDGALDLLNEVAIDAVGAPVIDDGDTLAVNNDVLLELLA
jgi:hypothetical protein